MKILHNLTLDRTLTYQQLYLHFKILWSNLLQNALCCEDVEELWSCATSVICCALCMYGIIWKTWYYPLWWVLNHFEVKFFRVRFFIILMWTLLQLHSDVGCSLCSLLCKPCCLVLRQNQILIGEHSWSCKWASRNLLSS